MKTKNLNYLSSANNHIIAITLLLSLTSIFCMPNIRIQVNNENLQSPPYLLEALKQADPTTTTTTTTLKSSNEPTMSAPSLEDQQPSQALATAETNRASNRSESSNSGDLSLQDEPILEDTQSQGGNNFNVVKEETIEEILELEPDSVLKLSPENISNSISPQDYAKLVSTQSMDGEQKQQARVASSPPVETIANEPALVVPNSVRKSQLPVTSSHLKRPAAALTGLLDDYSDHSVASSMVSETRAQMDDEDEAVALASSQFSRNSNGPKSRVSPSVAADEGPTVNLDKKPGQQPPDTIEPSQVMQGVSNASLVPATVTRQYGSNSRTRITLGGGYVRNKQPALVNPSSSDYVDDKPEKPVAPLEKPQYQASGGGGGGEPERSIQENSRLIEVPERIVLPASVFSQQQQKHSEISSGDKFLLINVTTTTTTKLGKPDSRCPKTGTSTLDHPIACDKYFFCEDGHISEHVCPNGLMYGERNHVKDYCVHRWEAVCEDKSVPNPISSPGCRWQWGIFSVQGSPRCTPDFYECRDGKFEVRKCSISGQVYDDKTKSCRYAEQVGCTEEALGDFKCPPDDQSNTYWPFPRYFLNERALIHCVNDKPAIVRCRDNERVDPEHLHCVHMSKSTQTSNYDSSDSPVSRSLRERSTKDKQQQQH